MSDPDFLVAIGVKSQDVIGGLCGGIANAFVFQKSGPLAVVGSVVVGCLTATYLSDTAAHYIGTTGPATAFLVGLSAMAICQGVVAGISKWKPGGGNVA